MTTATPIPPPHTADDPPSPAITAEPPIRSRAQFWLLLGGLALLVLAAGIASFVIPIGADGQTDVVNDHRAEAGEPTLIEVPGYSYADPEGSSTASFDSEMRQVNDQVAEVTPARFGVLCTAWSLHDVSNAGNDPVAELRLIEMNPQLMEQAGFSPDLVVSGFAGGMATSGATVTTETIDGETVAVAVAPEGDGVAFVWYHEGTASGVGGYDEEAVRTFVEAYITAQNN